MNFFGLSKSKVKKYLTPNSNVLPTIKSAIRGWTARGTILSIRFPFYKDQKKLLENKVIKNEHELFVYKTFSMGKKEFRELLRSQYMRKGHVNIEEGLMTVTQLRHLPKRFIGGSDYAVIVRLRITSYFNIAKYSIFPEKREVLVNNLKWKVSGDWKMVGNRVFMKGYEYD